MKKMIVAMLFCIPMMSMADNHGAHKGEDKKAVTCEKCDCGKKHTAGKKASCDPKTCECKECEGKGCHGESAG